MFLNSIFGQFVEDVVFIVPISMAFWLPYLLFFISIDSRCSVLPLTRRQVFYASRVKRISLFLFGDSSSSFNPWVAPLYSLFVALLIINMTGMLPYSLTLTSQVSFTFSLAIPFWGAMQLYGFLFYFNHRVSHFLPSGTPWFLVPLMVIIEFVGLFIQPLALGLRLAANITAGHLLLYLFSVAVWIIMDLSLLASFLILVTLYLLFILEVGVAVIQAYVFTALLKFYYEQNVSH
uniref:ATP synthase subunit a n=1 Tax=Chiridota heheva TaxID=2743191 RepID=A0A8E5JZD9_9ECHN|nr:ATP synthase F0 subunit 6 [Chiridota heheva]QVD42792.1 ATP synthase F0 subunit 6 [Chiridota heheva]